MTSGRADYDVGCRRQVAVVLKGLGAVFDEDDKNGDKDDEDEENKDEVAEDDSKGLERVVGGSGNDDGLERKRVRN
ncbi:uncharacterized protein A4U43_C05F8990 [Asparagus officinalis]|uniref:Uncharacterized protein n=1 Tax=Asparagus officinalis TaxID=4686 RepID=A0A5P1EQY6_ASPOF|nr:uncharacterized protein A4U43_C05F8990 [Asparagus officinalis]